MAKIPNQPALESKVEYEGPIRTQGTQTKMRESEAQTVPYTPDYIIPQGADPCPEILTLSHLKYGESLPATMQEVEHIERARYKKEFLSNLPPITDEASFNLRRKLMTEHELRELRLKEKDIEVVQMEHLRLIKNALHDREAEREFVSQQRLESVKQIKLDEKDARILEIQHERIKTLRKLTKKRETVEPETRDIIHEYSNFASKMYAPITRDGNLKQDSLVREESAYPVVLSSYDGIQYLETVMKPKLLKSKISRPCTKKSQSTKNLLTQLNFMDKLTKERKMKESKTEEPIEEEESEVPLWRKRAEKLIRPPTPRVAPSTVDLVLETAINMMQRLIRGRAVQNMMFEGKMKRLDLIRELRTEELLESNRDEISLESKRMEESTADAESNNGAWGAIQGEVIGGTLDLLAKEWTRMMQEKCIGTFVSEAENKRKRRESIQSGTRQAEELQRQREDIVYGQLMDVHHKTVDSYFDEILADSMDSVATEVALQYIHSDINAPLDSVRDIVSHFLIPNVNRETKREESEIAEKRFLAAAHANIYQAIKYVDESKHGE